MNISIVIPTLNEEKFIGKLLKSVLEQKERPYEIIVVDCGSHDDTQEIVRSYDGVTLFISDKPVGNQRTYGGKKARGDVLLFLDADVQLSSDFLQESMKQIQSKSLDIACPQYIPYPGSRSINIFYSFFNAVFKISERHMPSGAGSAIFVKRKLFQQLGGFKKELKFDDIHFIRAAARHGNFGMISTFVRVSDRRMREYGMLQTSMTYAILSVLFLFGAYRLSNYVPYRFGIFNKK